MEDQMSLFEFDGFELDDFDAVDTSETAMAVMPAVAEAETKETVEIQKEESDVTDDAADAENDEEAAEEAEDDAGEEDDEEEEGEVTATSSKKAGGPVTPPMTPVELAEKAVKDAEKAVNEEIAREKELYELPEEEIRKRVDVYLNSQMKIWEAAKNPTVFNILKLIEPHLRERAGRDKKFAVKLLLPGRTFAGMHMHVFEFFKKKAKEEYDKLSPEEKKTANYVYGYGSADNAELYAPADEYFETENAEKKLDTARGALDAAKKKSQGKKKAEKKPVAKKVKKTEEDEMASMFDESF